MKNYVYSVIDDNKVSWMSFHIFHIFENPWYNLAPNELVNQPIDWVRSIINELIYMLI